MLTYDEALALLRGLQVPAQTEELPIEHALGAVLAREVRAGCDQPPFDRATMDGIAVRSGERRVFRVVGAVMAVQSSIPEAPILELPAILQKMLIHLNF